MSNIDLIRQYVDTGLSIPEHQFNKLSNNLKKTYIRKRNIALEMGVEENLGGSAAFMEYEVPYLSDKAKIAIVKYDAANIRYIDNQTEELQKIAVEDYPDSIMYIKNPTEEVQIIAVKNSYRAYQTLVNNNIKTSDKVQIEALKNWSGNMYYIKNPSEKVKLIAAKEGAPLNYIPNPSVEIIYASIKKDGSNIKFVKDPTEELQRLAINEYWWNIEFIKNPSEALQLLSIKTSDGRSFKYLVNNDVLMSDRVKVEAVNQNYTNFFLIANPSERVKFATVNKNGFAIKHMTNPSEELQLAAVEHTPSAIKYIKNPSEKVQMAAAIKDPTIYKLFVKQNDILFDNRDDKLSDSVMDYIKSRIDINENIDRIKDLLK